MKQIKILFASAECLPFFKSGGLGDVAGSLPGYVAGTNYDIRVILPKLSQIPEKYTKKMEFVTSFGVPLSWRICHCGLFRLRLKGMTYYFLDNEYYFHRSSAYGEFDDGERYAFFSKAIVEAISYLDFEPDILHCNDWHTALAPVFMREFYHNDMYDHIKTIFTIHNLKFQGMYSEQLLADVLGLDNTPAADQLRVGNGAISFMQGACRYVDRITTVSPTYAEEICTPYFGEGLDWLFRERHDRLSGILNGIDNKRYDPSADPDIYYNFSEDNIREKRKNKLAFQKEFGLEEDEKIPMFAIISRLTEQKGIDLINYIMPRLMERRLQIVVLGIGDRQYEDSFRWFEDKYKGKVAALIKFDDALSHKIYASADAFLMPSRFEPCGLSQMFSMRYGTLPIVRETGGLKDSVTPYNKYTGEGTGFSFANYNADELYDCIDGALKIWEKKQPTWKKLQQNAMAADFSWRASANRYRALYRDLLKA